MKGPERPFCAVQGCATSGIGNDDSSAAANRPKALAPLQRKDATRSRKKDDRGMVAERRLGEGGVRAVAARRGGWIGTAITKATLGMGSDAVRSGQLLSCRWTQGVPLSAVRYSFVERGNCRHQASGWRDGDG